MKLNPVRKSWWPVGLISVFVLFISWIATFIGIAVSNSMDLVSPDYYEQEILYQQRIDSMNRLNGLTGFSIRHDANVHEISVQLPEEHIGKAVTGRFKFYRPDDAKLDHSIAIQPSETGRQTLSIGDLKPGGWKLETSWVLGDETFYASTNIKR